MKHAVAHPFDPATARAIVERAFETYRSRYPAYDPKIAWTSDRTASVGFSAKGVHLQGRIAIRDKTIDLELDVPLLLRVFQKRAIEIVDREVKKWIDEAKVDSA